MKLDKELMEKARKYPEETKRIFKRARQSRPDMERDEVRYLIYEIECVVWLRDLDENEFNKRLELGTMRPKRYDEVIFNYVKAIRRDYTKNESR
jgi:hypothetical protein